MSDQNDTPRDRQPEGRRPAWQSGTPRGQERVVSYESDERYWTDYLRVALPVVGLLLMLGLLFWWANSIIGDENGSAPTSTVTAGDGSEVALAPTNTAVNTPEGELTPDPVPTETPAEDPNETGGDETEEPDDTATEEPADCDSDFALGDQVELTEGGVNFRPEPNLEPGEYPQLASGSVLEIVDDCFTLADDDETRFWQVRVIASEDDAVGEGDRGYVSEEYFELSE